MSKTLESLRLRPAKDDILNKHIVDTYFYKKPRRRQALSKISKKRLLAIPALGIIIGCAIFYALSSTWSFFSERYTAFIRSRLEASLVIPVFESGRPLNSLVSNQSFRGCAKGYSRVTIRGIHLFSPKKYGWADYALDLRFPVDLSSRYLALTVKGERGGEKISVVIRDANRRAITLGDIYLTTKWKTELLPLKAAAGDIDIKRIDHIRIETGFVGDPPARALARFADVKTYIQDIRLLKKETGI